MINYITEPIAKIAGGLKDKIVSIFNTSTPKQTVYGRGKKLMIRDIWTLYGTEEEKKEINDTSIKDGITKYIRTLFE